MPSSTQSSASDEKLLYRTCQHTVRLQRDTRHWQPGQRNGHQPAGGSTRAHAVQHSTQQHPQIVPQTTQQPAANDANAAAVTARGSTFHVQSGGHNRAATTSMCPMCESTLRLSPRQVVHRVDNPCMPLASHPSLHYQTEPTWYSIAAT